MSRCNTSVFLVLNKLYIPDGIKNMNNGIEIIPRNFNMLKIELDMKLFGDWIFSVSVFRSVISATVEYVLGFKICWLKIVWLVKPSTSFDSSLSDEIGKRTKIKIKIRNGNFRKEVFCFLNLRKKIIDSGIMKNNDSYLTIAARPRKIKEIK